MVRNRIGIFLVVSLILLQFFGGAVRANEDIIRLGDEEVAGEFFGQPVPMGNYRFAKAAILVFGAQWGGEPQTPEELEKRVWEDLLLSYEAYRRGIAVSDEELFGELDAILKSEKVTFDRKTERAAYEKWIGERVKEPAQAFENQLKHLIQLKKLRQQVMDSMEPSVSEEEAYDEYLNEYNTLSVELVQFDDEAKAQDFYKKMKNPKLWDRESKKNPKFAVRPGFVSLECLMDLWKIPREDAYAMLELPVDSVYPPAPIYRGYGVFRTLEKRVAVKEKFPQLRDSYYDQVKMKKRYDGYSDWLQQLKAEAQTKVYLASPGPRPPAAGRQEAGK